jgi:chromosome segregation ATPase
MDKIIELLNKISTDHISAHTDVVAQVEKTTDISKQHLGILNVIKDEAKKIKDELVNNIQTLTSTLASLNKEIEDKKNTASADLKAKTDASAALDKEIENKVQISTEHDVKITKAQSLLAGVQTDKEKLMTEYTNIVNKISVAEDDLKKLNLEKTTLESGNTLLVKKIGDLTTEKDSMIRDSISKKEELLALDKAIIAKP